MIAWLRSYFPARLAYPPPPLEVHLPGPAVGVIGLVARTPMTPTAANILLCLSSNIRSPSVVLMAYMISRILAHIMIRILLDLV